MIEDQPNQSLAQSDEEILTLSRSSPELFRVLIARYETAFLRKAKSILGNREEVQDVVVETFTKIYLKGAQFKPQPGASFRSWAYKILTNTALTYYQKLKRHEGRTTTEVDFGFVAGRTTLEPQLDWRDNFAAVLTRLPAQFARILKLSFMEEKTHQEIAELEGLSSAAVKTRLHRAKKAFRKISSLAEYV